MISGILEEMTIEDVRALSPNVAIVPCGSTEPHGPALPYGTDSFTITAIARNATRQANAAGGRVVCYPTLPITLNNNFKAFPFALRVSVPTFMATLVDIVDQAWADGVTRVVIANGHGGTTDAIRTVLRDLAGRTEGPFVCTVNGWGMAEDSVKATNVEAVSDHAGEGESSLQMFLHPDLVRADKLADNPRNPPAVACLRGDKVHFVRPWHLYVPASAGGDARKASAAKGKALIESASRVIGGILLELSQAPESATFPY